MRVAAVEVSGLRVQRSPQFALEISSLKILPGEIICVTGPNGCGKTTLLECLMGLVRPTAGTVRIGHDFVGKNLRHTKAMLGYVPDVEDWLIKELCAKEYFDLLHKVYRQAGITLNLADRTQELAAQLQFTHFLQSLGSLSHGNKKKVQIIAALMHQPPVIIVDEIRNGLDPLAIVTVEELLRSEAQRGASIIAATHDLWWSERMGRRTLLLLGGHIATLQATTSLVKKFGSLEQFFVRMTREHNTCDST